MKVTKPNLKIMTAIRIVFGLCCLLTAGTAFAQKVTVDFDKDIDFSKYRTYAFAKGTPAPVPLVNQRIEEAIEEQLAAKGLTKVESDPDLIVVYHAAVSKQTQLDTTYLGGWGWGRGWRRWGGGGSNAITRVEQIPIGHLIVDIGDAAGKRYIWRGTASKTLSSKPDKNTKSIEEGVRKMFEKFPPREKK